MRIAALPVVVLAAYVTATAALADTLTLESPAQRVSLLELYTSEGCSSCPPADRWLSRLEDDPRLWRELVPVALHVDYWDYIGWPDRFASPAFSARQKRYARSGRLQSVYTPGLVLGGKEWRAWFYRPVLTLERGEAVGPLRIELEDGAVRGIFEPTAMPGETLELHVALLGFDLKTEVGAGENDGKTLEHDFVVLGHARAPMRRVEGSLIAQTERLEWRFDSRRKAIAAWVSASGDPYPIQAVGGWIENP